MDFQVKEPLSGWEGYTLYNEQDQTEFDGSQIKLVSEDQADYLKYGLDQKNEKLTKSTFQCSHETAHVYSIAIWYQYQKLEFS